jgi:hypothetical protein
LDRPRRDGHCDEAVKRFSLRQRADSIVVVACRRTPFCASLFAAAALLLRIVHVHAYATAIVEDLDPVHFAAVERHAFGTQYLPARIPLDPAYAVGKRVVPVALRLRRNLRPRWTAAASTLRPRGAHPQDQQGGQHND